MTADTKHDSGPAWALRRFAKPLVTGSIPATVSIILRPKFGQPLMGPGHRFQIGQAIGEWLAHKRGAFWSGIRQGRDFPAPDDQLRAAKDEAFLASCAKQTAERELVYAKASLIEARKEISRLKRQKT